MSHRRRSPAPRLPLVFDAQGVRWTVLHTAERSYLRAAAALHPDITAEHARAEWPEFLARIHHVRRDAPPLEVWRADGEFDRLYVIVERVEGGFRVCDVRPAHQPRPGDAVARRGPPAPSVAAAAPTDPPEPPAIPDVDPATVLAVGAELSRGTYPSAGELHRRLHLPIADVRAALSVLTAHAPPVALKHPWHGAEIAGVEVLPARRNHP